MFDIFNRARDENFYRYMDDLKTTGQNARARFVEEELPRQYELGTKSTPLEQAHPSLFK